MSKQQLSDENNLQKKLNYNRRFKLQDPDTLKLMPKDMIIIIIRRLWVDRAYSAILAFSVVSKRYKEIIRDFIKKEFEKLEYGGEKEQFLTVLANAFPSHMYAVGCDVIDQLLQKAMHIKYVDTKAVYYNYNNFTFNMEKIRSNDAILLLELTSSKCLAALGDLIQEKACNPIYFMISGECSDIKLDRILPKMQKSQFKGLLCKFSNENILEFNMSLLIPGKVVSFEFSNFDIHSSSRYEEVMPNIGLELLHNNTQLLHLRFHKIKFWLSNLFTVTFMKTLLNSNKMLRVLDFEDCSLTKEVSEKIAAVLIKPKCRITTLNCRFSDAEENLSHLLIIGSLSHNRSVMHLSIDHRSIYALISLRTAFANNPYIQVSTIIANNLFNQKDVSNDFNNASIGHFLSIIQHPVITEIECKSNFDIDQLAVIAVEAAKNPNLKKLTLSAILDKKEKFTNRQIGSNEEVEAGKLFAHEFKARNGFELLINSKDDPIMLNYYAEQKEIELTSGLALNYPDL